ncbi:uncharacterized protein Pyn_23347 [Prunus yedoensis var. nudiflora]|uniref:Uncharacterized protein n=1 Tax=Prunus yedoensis var. nudiflora TaxID=2094558 RepID=A0A314UNR3_PRUYE|nr:uncharacterized protein Pyn_23347 [Prunus yedoensis var. nudiflora]
MQVSCLPINTNIISLQLHHHLIAVIVHLLLQHHKVLLVGLEPATQATGMNANSNGVWTNGMPFQQQNTSFPNGFPNNSSPWPSPYNHQYPYQMPIPERLPFYPQAEGQRFLSGAVLPGGQLNSFAGPTYSQGLMGQHGFNQTTFGIGLQGQPTPGQQLNAFAGPMYPQGMVGQHGFNQNAFGMGLQGQPTHPTLNADQGMLSNRLPVEQNCNMPQPVANTGNVGMQQFNPGASSNRERSPLIEGVVILEGEEVGSNQGESYGMLCCTKHTEVKLQ